MNMSGAVIHAIPAMPMHPNISKSNGLKKTTTSGIATTKHIPRTLYFFVDKQGMVGY